MQLSIKNVKLSKITYQTDKNERILLKIIIKKTALKFLGDTKKLSVNKHDLWGTVLRTR